MTNLTTDQFRAWMGANGIRQDTPGSISFAGDEFMFRVPIGDYRLQLDYRIEAALALLPAAGDLLLFRRSLRWDVDRPRPRPLDAVLRAVGVDPAAAALSLSNDERQLALAIAYLTNRWGRSADSLYVASAARPEPVLYVPGSPESVFVITRSLAEHEKCLAALHGKTVPAYGPHVRSPIPEPLYDDIRVGTSVVEVDPATGKPIGPGSDESALSPEYLPPPD